eukprot:m.459704 g.459704  ORF g.459704 m.459704 type:complete len:89 (+) comp20342_c6_seq8:1508-1774(+)
MFVLTFLNNKPANQTQLQLALVREKHLQLHLWRDARLDWPRTSWVVNKQKQQISAQPNHTHKTTNQKQSRTNQNKVETKTTEAYNDEK